MYNLYMGYCHGPASFVTSYVDGFYTKMSINSTFCVVYRGLIRLHSQESASSQPTWMGTVEASYCTMPFISTKIYRQRLGRNGRLLPSWTIRGRNCETQYFNLFRRTLPLLRTFPLTFARACGFSTKELFPNFHAKFATGWTATFQTHVSAVGMGVSNHLGSIFSSSESI
jgi:hypothetical protein